MLLNNLKSIVILVTMECNCSCDHCFYFPRNHNHNHAAIDPDLIDDALESISGQYDIKTVHFAGGEPFFYYDVMVECIKRCKKHGIEYFSVSTNGAWANDPEVVRGKVSHLRELGVNSIGVSADSFHQRAIPLENVDGCFGVPLGNLYKASMLDIFKRYFNDPNPIIQLLHEKGALGLKQLAVERGFTPNNTYYDECHLCHTARNYLKKHCPEEFGAYLTPDTCYPSITWRGYGKEK